MNRFGVRFRRVRLTISARAATAVVAAQLAFAVGHAATAVQANAGWFARTVSGATGAILVRVIALTVPAIIWWEAPTALGEAPVGAQFIPVHVAAPGVLLAYTLLALAAVATWQAPTPTAIVQLAHPLNTAELLGAISAGGETAVVSALPAVTVGDALGLTFESQRVGYRWTRVLFQQDEILYPLRDGKREVLYTGHETGLSRARALGDHHV